MTKEFYHNICDYISDLIRGTEWEGNVYAVGGCCRDELMNMPINDVDLAVNTPDGGVKFGRWLYDHNLTVTKPTEFIKYGTAKLQLARFPDDEIEIVQTRREKYTDRNSRNPETAFGSLEDDCLRRDLTINSLYYDISRCEYVDKTGNGINDIHNHIIRTPNNPDVTFDDDPVRILRCVRFAAKFGWTIDTPTFKALKRNVYRLKIVSVERIKGELEKMLLLERPSIALNMLYAIGALKYVLPGLKLSVAIARNRYHFGTVWQHTLKDVDSAPADLTLRLAVLLHDIGRFYTLNVDKDGKDQFFKHERPDRMVSALMRRLRYRGDFIRKVKFLVNNYSATNRWENEFTNKYLSERRKQQ